MPGKAEQAPLDARRVRRDETLDHELEQTFPASDPPSSTQPGTRSGAPDRGARERRAAIGKAVK